MAKAKRDKERSAAPASAGSGHAIQAGVAEAAYFAAMDELKPPARPRGMAGLEAWAYWMEYFADPDHLLPQDTPFVRGRIWS